MSARCVMLNIPLESQPKIQLLHLLNSFLSWPSLNLWRRCWTQAARISSGQTRLLLQRDEWDRGGTVSTTSSNGCSWTLLAFQDSRHRCSGFPCLFLGCKLWCLLPKATVGSLQYAFCTDHVK